MLYDLDRDSEEDYYDDAFIDLWIADDEDEDDFEDDRDL
jgi:hypothetical protein